MEAQAIVRPKKEHHPKIQTIIIIIIPTVNVLPEDHLTMTGSLRNEDILMSIRDGWERIFSSPLVHIFSNAVKAVVLTLYIKV